MRRGIRIGLDVGSVRVGIATCDPDGILATPVRTVARDPQAGLPRTTDPDVAEIAALVAGQGAVEVVVGLPRHLTGVEGEAAGKARQYARAVAELIAPVDVRLVDERLTSVDAHRALRESGVAGRRQRAVVDQAAAVLILQSALDEERRTGRPPGRSVTERRKPRTKGTTA